MPRHDRHRPPDRPPVRVEIGELVLHGLPATQRDAIAAAFADRLAALIREHGVQASGVSASADAAPVAIEAAAAPDAVGRAVASSVYHVLRGGDR